MMEKYNLEMGKISHLLTPYLAHMRPDIGYYCSVNDIIISAEVFPKEYNEIVKILHSCLEKSKEFLPSEDKQRLQVFYKSCKEFIQDKTQTNPIGEIKC
jgi:hypothetical protein